MGKRKRQKPKHKRGTYFSKTNNITNNKEVVIDNENEFEKTLEFVRDAEKNIERRKEFKMKTTDGVARNFMRGEVYYVLREGFEGYEEEINSGGRPAIIVSNDMLNEFNHTVSVLYLTSNPFNEKAPTTIPIRSVANNKRGLSFALCDQISTVHKLRIGKRCGELSEYELKNVEKGIMLAFGCHEENLEDFITKWTENIKKYPTETLIENIDENFSNFGQTDFNGIDYDNNINNNEKLEENKKETSIAVVDKADVLEFDITQTAEYNKILGERDAYKNMLIGFLGKDIKI